MYVLISSFCAGVTPAITSRRACASPGDHTCTQCSCDSAHSACVWNDYAFYVLDNVPAYLDVSSSANSQEFLLPLLLRRRWRLVPCSPLRESVLLPGFLHNPDIFHHFSAMFCPLFQTAMVILYHIIVLKSIKNSHIRHEYLRCCRSCIHFSKFRMPYLLLRRFRRSGGEQFCG